MNETVPDLPTKLPPSGVGDPFAAYAATATRDGVLLKFNKSGEWIAALNSGATVVPASTELVALMSEFALAWTRWIANKPTDRHVTLVASGAAPARRDQLGDLDQTMWESDDEGKLRDPWQATHELPLLDPESGEKYVFSTNSVGGKAALGKLAGAFSRGRARHPNCSPVVALGGGGYEHKIKSRGWIHVPTLRIVSWVPASADHETPKAALPQVMNDAIPSEAVAMRSKRHTLAVEIDCHDVQGSHEAEDRLIRWLETFGHSSVGHVFEFFMVGRISRKPMKGPLKTEGER